MQPTRVEVAMSASIATVPTSPPSPSGGITVEEVMDDLEVGRTRPLVPVVDVAEAAAEAPVRPALGGPAFLATLATVQALGRVNARLSRPALEALWFTPWTVGRERTLPDAAVRRTYRTGGMALEGWELGSGPTVLLVHGWGGRSTDLKSVAVALAEQGLRAVAVDMPGHGRSPGRRTHLVEMAQAVRSLAHHLGPLRGIVTHSVGGAATVLALQEGVEVERVALLAPPRRLQHAVARFGEAAKLPTAVEESLRRLLEERFGATIWEDLAVEASVGRIAVRALVVHDADDEEISIEDGRTVADVLGGDFMGTEGLGHGRVLVDPDVLRRVAAHMAT